MIAADDLYSLYRPSYCRRRVYMFANRPELAAAPSEYDQLIMARGVEHERAHLTELGEAVCPKCSAADLLSGAKVTQALMEQGLPVVYRGVLGSPSADVVGIPASPNAKQEQA